MSAQLQSSVAGPLDEALDTLQSQQWSVTTLGNWLPEIVHHRFELQAAQRIEWLVGLRKCWEEHCWSLSCGQLAECLTLCADWQDWPLVIDIATHLEQQRRLTASEKSLLAQACLHCGDLDQAIDHYRGIVLAEPGFQPAVYGLQRARAWAEYCGQFPYYASGLRTAGALRLEPLGEHHIQDFAWQYYDPAIAQRCCLPQFESDEHWRHWLAEGDAQEDQMTFAVIHSCWGLIGSVSLILQDGIGFFYYWLGRDFQGNGFGPGAATLLFQLAETHWGMHACYAKVFADNTPSRRGLKKLGFRAVDFAIDSGHDNEIHLRRPAPYAQDISTDAMAEEAREAFARMKLQSLVMRPYLPDQASRSIQASIRHNYTGAH